jgi:lysophospholipase L1-like esterase
MRPVPGRTARLSVLTLFVLACGPSGGTGTAGGGGTGGTGVPPGSGGSSGTGGAHGSGGAVGSGGAGGRGDSGAPGPTGSGGAASGGAPAASGGAPGSGGAGASGGRGGGASISGGSSGIAGLAGTNGASAGQGGGRGEGAGGAGARGAPVGPDPDAAARMACTGSDPITCHFGGQPGNYDVTVVLGGAAVASTSVQAEASRAMLNAIPTAAGTTQRLTFTVNVRQPEGQPLQDVPAGTPGLDLYLYGSGGTPPRLDGIGYTLAARPFLIYIAGDSTVCDYTDTDHGGWGQQLPPYFDFPVSVANYADSGESSGSFLNSSALFGAIESRLKTNDWVFIQFGHNDKDVAATAFHDNLTSYVKRVRAKGASPLLITPVARATFSGNTVTAQHVNNTGANLPEIVKQVATEQSVPVLDMTARTVQWLNHLGPNGWQGYHALGTDATHTNPAGAAVEAGFVRDLIRQANLTALTSRMR